MSAESLGQVHTLLFPLAGPACWSVIVTPKAYLVRLHELLVLPVFQFLFYPPSSCIWTTYLLPNLSLFCVMDSQSPELLTCIESAVLPLVLQSHSVT